MEAFLPVGILFIFSLVVCSVIYLAIRWIAPKNPFPSKLRVYECGVVAEGNARQPFSSNFYLIAVLFLLFDVEAAFFLPWALIYRDSVSEGPALLIAGMIYLGFVVLGMLFVLRKNVLRLDP